MKKIILTDHFSEGFNAGNLMLELIKNEFDVEIIEIAPWKWRFMTVLRRFGPVGRCSVSYIEILSKFLSVLGFLRRNLNECNIVVTAYGQLSLFPWFLTGRNYTLIVWDDYEGFVKESVPYGLRNFGRRLFYRNVTHSRVIGVASDKMGRYYTGLRKSDLPDYHVLIRPIDTPLPAVYTKPSSDALSIGLCGNAYAVDICTDVIRHVSKAGSVPIRVEALGGFGKVLVEDRFPPQVEIVNHGWVDHAVHIEVLARCEFGLHCYWLNRDRDLHSMLSFPNKVISFLEAGIPIVYVGPSETAVAEFINEYGCGLVFEEPKALFARINELLKNLDVARALVPRARARFASSEFRRGVDGVLNG